jgi:RimJ/RimL family protein N-acetyltransferase
MTEAARDFLPHVFAAIPDDAIYSGAFHDNAASLRVQEKLGFERDGEAVSFSNPHQKNMAHVNTVLRRARFAAVTVAV